MAEFPEFAPDEPISPLEKPEFAPNEPVSPLTVSQRQRAFREQIRMGQPEQAAQISYGGEKLAAPMPEAEQPKTGMFLGTDEQGRPVAVEQPITGGEKPQGILERMSQAAKAGLGEEPFGISPETQKKYPWASTLQLAAYPADVLLRGLNAFVAGGAGAVAGAAEEMGMSPAMASRLQRDIYQASQVAGVEMPKPTPGMMTRPIVRAAEAAAPTVETVEMMTGKPPAPPPVSLPTIPVAEGVPFPEVRGKGARLLPPETPHEPIKLPEPAAELPSRAGVGAEAAAGPLEGISSEAINQVARQLKADNWTPWTIDERLEKMSPHQFLAEVSPNLENRAAQVASYGGEGRNTIKTNVDQRHTEIKPRLKVLYDEAFGPVENLAQERRVLDIEQAKAADPLYQKFRDLQIHPTEKLKELSELFEKKGVFAEAKDIAEWQRVPWEENFFTPGKRKTYPTAQSWDLVKQALDAKIEGSFVDGRPTKWTRIYTQAKNDLINAIDNHPNPEIAGVWKEARAAYAEPASIKTAYDFGKKLLSDAVDANEVPFFTAAHSSKEMSAIAAGIRYELENQLGRAGAQEGRSIRQILSDNAQNKIRWIIGDEKAEKLFNAVDLENQIHGAQKRLIGGSPTAERMLGAAEEFGAKPPRGAELAGEVFETGVGLIKEPKKTVTKAVSKFATEKMARAAEEKAAQLRAEIARIYTLQGPERDAALRWILEHGENWTGAPEVKLPGMRSSGGSVLDKMHAAKRRKDGGQLDGPFDEAVEAQAAREAAARQIAGGIKGKPYEPTPPSTEGKTWIMEPGLEAVQSGYAEPFFHLPENTAVNEGGEVYNKETGEPLSIVRRPNVIPLAKTPDGIRWAMPKMLELAGNVMNPLAVTRGVPVKAGEMVLGAGPVKTVPEGGVLGAMKEAKAAKEAEKALPSISEKFAGKAGTPVEEMENLLEGVRGTEIGKMVERYQDMPVREAHQALFDDLKKLAQEGEIGKEWYEKSSARILDFLGGDKDAADKFAQLIAIYSPQTAVDVNTQNAVKAYNRALAGQPLWDGRIVERDIQFPTIKAANDYVKSLGGSKEGYTKIPLDDSGKRFLIAQHGEKNAYENIATLDRDLKAHLVMNEDIPFEGRKINNFYNNLMVQIDPSRLQSSTQDLWMARAFGFLDDAVGGGAKYDYMERLTADLAKELGWKPHQVQAAIWTAMKTRQKGVLDAVKSEAISKGIADIIPDPGNKGKTIFQVRDGQERAYGQLLREKALGAEITPESIAAAARNFSDFLDQNVAHISWESAPSTKIGHLNGFEALPPQAKAEYHVGIQKALQNDEGQDLLARYLNILSPGAIDAPGYWEKASNPATLTQIGATRIKAAKQRPDIDVASKKIMDIYASALGLLLKQDGVGYHRPYYNPQITKANGVEFKFEKPLSREDIINIGQALDDKFKGSVALIPSGENEIRVLNFGDTKNQKGFHKAVADIILNDKINNAADFRVFASDGDLVSNNWRANPNGQDYIQRISSAGRSDVLEYISDFLAPRVEAFDKSFAAKYGLKRNEDLEKQIRNLKQVREQKSTGGFVSNAYKHGGSILHKMMEARRGQR